jgi:hypothetical protein
MGMMRRNKRKQDAANVDKFLDELRQEMGNHAPLPPKAEPTLKDFLSSVAFLAGWAVAGSVALGLCLRLILFVAGL